VAFEGVVIARDGIASSEKQVVMRAVNAGIDLVMCNETRFCDDAVGRILRLKLRLDLWNRDYSQFAVRMILLKNDNRTLPL
jgi:beta-glucosidase-like glycosyl hydrolase